MKSGRTIVLLLISLLSACSPGGAEPALEATAVPASDLNPDAQAYAADHGISLAEASRRLNLQDEIGELGAALEANEADTFAGLWIEHEPIYKVVVALVGDVGEEVIRPYLTDPALADIIEIRPAHYTLAELQAAQMEAFRIIGQLEPFSVAGGVDVKQNQVYLTVGNPELFLEAIADAGYELPPMVIIEPIDPENIPESNAGGVNEYTMSDGQTLFFPRQAPAVAGMDALLEGTLILDDSGCLRVQHESVPLAEAPVVIWHYDFSLEISDEEIVVLNGAGDPIGRVGEWTRMGGGESRTVSQPEMPDACPGPYWILGSIDTLAEQAIPDIYLQPVSTGSGATYYFQSRAAADEGSISGTFSIEDGCFQVDGFTIFWPPDIWPDSDVSPLQIVYRKDNVEAVLFTLGEEVELSGGEKTAVDYRFFENKVTCPGPFWGVAALLPK